MALQNRVSAFGAIEAVEARGTLLGNRGCLHDAAQRLGARRWTSPRWIACVLAFKGRRRTVMAPGRYTELFFLDEPTALAAGHRPCAECRRPDYLRFIAAWRCAKGIPADAALGADATDAVLHAERLDGKAQRRFRAMLATLPDGVMVARAKRPEEALLLWRGALHPWAHEGYGAPLAFDPSADVDVLTPISICAVLRHGYRPTDPAIGRLAASGRP